MSVTALLQNLLFLLIVLLLVKLPGFFMARVFDRGRTMLA